MEQNTENDFQVKDQEGLLRAWNQWKEICAVEGIERDSQELLAPVIANAWRGKLMKSFPKQADRIWHDMLQGAQGLEAQMDVCHEFDGALEIIAEGDRKDARGKEENQLLRKKKKWKNVVWQEVHESQDPPLEVIHGRLVGGQGVINDIVEDYVDENYFCKKKGIFGDMESYEAKEAGGMSWEEKLGEWLKPGLGAVEMAECRNFVEELSSRALAMLPAWRYKLLSKPSFLEFVELSQSQAYGVFNKELAPQLRAFFEDKRAMGKESLAYIVEICRKRLEKSEKPAGHFLKDVDAAEKNEL